MKAFLDIPDAGLAFFDAAVIQLRSYKHESVRELYSNHLSEVQEFSKLSTDFLRNYLD
jgi:hypothetical protein